MKFRIGDRVILISHNLGNSPSNPVWEGKYGCVGTIYGFVSDNYPFIVHWDNKKPNSYQSKHLSLYKSKLLKNNPNVVYKKEILKK